MFQTGLEYYRQYFQTCSNQTAKQSKYSCKRFGKCATKRFTQLYLDYLSDKDKMNQAFNFWIQDTETLDFRRLVKNAWMFVTTNRTLNFLVGLDGVKYAKMLEGASNSYEFLRFFDEASQAEERALRDFLNDIGIKLLFLPVYSVEEVFSKLKYLLKYRSDWTFCSKI